MPGSDTLTEQVFNTALGNALMKANPRWSHKNVLIERTKTLLESSGKRADILITDIQPVAIETSAIRGDADMDAKARLGLHFTGNGREIQTAIVVDLADADVNRSTITTRHVMKYALHQLPARRFPETGFIHGDVHDLARLISSTAITKERMELVADSVAKKVLGAANILEPAIKKKDLMNISKTMYQRSALTGLRTTMVLWLNALLVQRRLYGGVYDIPTLIQTPSECVKAWRIIHEINWRAIFGPAIDILDKTRLIATPEVAEALGLLIGAVEEIETAGLGSDINIGAELFPKIAEDRKKSAAFYTQSATAELLAALTITHDMAEWSDPNIFESFCIADITCGTGTLLRFAYRQAKMHHIASGGKSLDKIHRDAMECGLVGTDVSPIAAHLTSTSLALDTKQPYGDTRIGWVGVGARNRTGAIEYIKRNSVQDLLMSQVGLSSGQSSGAGYNSVVIKHDSMDVIIMNPPYSRTRGGQSAFDIAGLSDAERDACQEKWGRLIKDEPCVKTAGMAATFLCLARKKIKPGGRIGFVLPRTAAFADTWERTRAMLEKDFEDIMAVAVSSGKALGRKAFSADTMMEEMLLVATRKKGADTKQSPIKCVTLYEPVTRIGEAVVVARAILDGNGPIIVGGEVGVSHIFETNKGQPWSFVGAIHSTVAAIANDLAAGTLRDVSGDVVASMQMTTLGELFGVGKSHDSIGHIAGGDPRGAFEFNMVVSDTDAIGIHRSLWKADAKTQTRMVVLPTHKGTPHTSKADSIWATRSKLFYSRGMRWNTQSVVAATTKHDVMGGSAWTSLSHDDIRIQKVFALWSNSIFGMLIHWTRGSRTHSGRSRMQVRAISKVPCPDFTAFDLDRAAAEFDRLSVKSLLPAHMSKDDKVRAEINGVVAAMLGVPDYDTDSLTRMWCAEPSVRGKCPP